MAELDDETTKGRVHINFGVPKDPKESALRTSGSIIHEVSHKVAQTMDHGHVDQPKYWTLTRAQAVDNADSYALTAVSPDKGYCFKDYDDMAAAAGRGVSLNV